MGNEFFSERSIAEVELSRIVQNYEIYKGATASGARIIAVVKADAYGHGDMQISRALEACGVDFFAVSNINEGIRLRENGISGEILILGYTPVRFSEELTYYRLSQAIVSEEHLRQIQDFGKNEACYHIALDLGMHRIGLNCNDISATVSKIKNAAKTLKIKGVFTHFPVADSTNPTDIEFTRSAVATFDEICARLSGLGIEHFHCQNSAAGLLHSSRCSNAIRLGISLYGYAPSSDIALPQGILPALSWKSRVACVLNVKKGESIGYGRSFVAERDMRVATITAGYADGYPRVLSNKGYVLINGSHARIVGRICMDMMMADASALDRVNAGDEVILIGESNGEKITADDLARGCGSISYEILCGISKRVKRVYI